MNEIINICNSTSHKSESFIQKGEDNAKNGRISARYCTFCICVQWERNLQCNTCRCLMYIVSTCHRDRTVGTGLYLLEEIYWSYG